MIGKRDERGCHAIDVNHFTEPVDYDDGLIVTEGGHEMTVASLLRDRRCSPSHGQGHDRHLEIVTAVLGKDV